MTPSQRRRMVWVLLLLLASGLATTLVAFALQRNIAYLYTPSEVLRGDVDAQSRFRLGGMVVKGSFERASGSLDAHFVVTDGDAVLPVTTSRILPDMFREGTAVVASGRLQDGRFIADEVLAKHDENYIPKEVADKMGQAHTRHDVTMPAAETR
ncbi:MULTISPECIES: cytochrome c maturation protein CcmE [Stenotrophomonas]|jgi:cytochrome c-type biogenesis protein CcmE|uniref:Cytochrome c-type biogenesis protein CcmE n=2 Tax=Stenotrophomonas TaxID=40323 RepID=A0A4V3RJM8_STEMA|nr:MULTISPECIES: cytochrome c maturation protein CcmE [Stenotrophomonas]MBD3826883.1 cytochrome c maturation protein CcmE [Stenotrophomonas sp.]QIO88750.1 cytochrome c biogenesis protein CcmE [Stenotrophomonas rhizophila]TGY36510.1 cytochrome c biogenesis protein CcmE [Stenotrophomonas maltophilia]